MGECEEAGEGQGTGRVSLTMDDLVDALNNGRLDAKRLCKRVCCSACENALVGDMGGRQHRQHNGCADKWGVVAAVVSSFVAI